MSTYEKQAAGATDAELARWLADNMHVDVRRVEAELEEGRRRREFVVAELLEAGYSGDELLGLVLHLTGLPVADARALIASRYELDGS